MSQSSIITLQRRIDEKTINFPIFLQNQYKIDTYISKYLLNYSLSKWYGSWVLCQFRASSLLPRVICSKCELLQYRYQDTRAYILDPSTSTRCELLNPTRVHKM